MKIAILVIVTIALIFGTLMYYPSHTSEAEVALTNEQILSEHLSSTNKQIINTRVQTAINHKSLNWCRTLDTKTKINCITKVITKNNMTQKEEQLKILLNSQTTNECQEIENKYIKDACEEKHKP
ncbi:MAG: hypothetical protein ACMXX6_01310 [Candidatus Woesearchaeota archaeon]